LIEWLPAASVLVLKDTAPADSAGAPICVVPSRIVTLPVGAPEPLCGATEMLSVSVWPTVSCVADALTDVVVVIFAGRETTTVATDDMDPAKLESPEYDAVMLCEPAASVEVENVAAPLFTVAVPSEVVPSLNVTVPVGLPLPDCAVTVAVNCTLCPTVGVMFEAVSEVLVPTPELGPCVKTSTFAEYASNV